MGLSASFNLYKAYRKGHAHFASYLPDFMLSPFAGLLIAAPMEKGLRGAIVSKFPLIISIFAVSYLSLRSMGRDFREPLSLKRWPLVVALSWAVSSLAFSRLGPEMLIVIASSFPFFVVFLFIHKLYKRHGRSAYAAVKALGEHRIDPFFKRHYPKITAFAMALFLYSVFADFKAQTRYQWALASALLVMAGLAYIWLSKADGTGGRLKTPFVFIVYLVVSLIVFYPSLNMVHRGDYWFIASLFNSVNGFSFEAAKRISFFEMFGDMRFQPGAHLLMYARHVLFGNMVVLYGLSNIFLHSTCAFLVFYSIKAFTDEDGLSFALGALFIVLPSQFDTVMWTYHVYIIAGVICVLAAVVLAQKKTQSGSMPALAFALSIIAVFLYEPAVMAPWLVSFIVLGPFLEQGRAPQKGVVYRLLFWTAFVYLIYAGVTLYGFSIARPGSGKMSMKDVIKWEPVREAFRVTLYNLLETSLIKNLGVIRVSSDLTVYLPTSFFSEAGFVVKAVFGVFLALLIRAPRMVRYAAVALFAMAFSYLYVIFLGRSVTNVLDYMVSQPRYQYFANAVFVVVAGILLKESFIKRHLRPVMLAVFGALFVWNAGIVIAGNARAAYPVSGLQADYAKLKAFTKDNPRAKVFMDVIPAGFGEEIALDLLFKENVTKSLKKAAYIYDGKGFKRNVPGAYGDSGDGAFTVSWMYYHNEGYQPKKDIVIAGSDNILPEIRMTPSGFIRVKMAEAETGRTIDYEIRHAYTKAYTHPRLDRWASFAVEKDKGFLCLFFNGVLIDKVRLKTPVKAWDKDGPDLIGGYYNGAGEMVMLSKFFIQTDVPMHNCAGMPAGASLPTKLEKPW